MGILDPSLIRAYRIWRGQTIDSTTGSQSLTSFHDPSVPKDVINVQTEIRMEEIELDQNMPKRSDIESDKTSLEGPEFTGNEHAHGDMLRTKVEAGHEFDPSSTLHTHWDSSELSILSKPYETDTFPEDTGSMTDLRIGEQEQVDEIRSTQKLRARQRQHAEHIMKRQI